MNKKHAVVTPDVTNYLNRGISKAKTCLNDLDGIKAYIHLSIVQDTINGLYGDLVETDEVTEAIIKRHLPEYISRFSLKHRFCKEYEESKEKIKR
jgi:hypothetical protein